MRSLNYLSHCSVELGPSEEWNQSADGLHFVLPYDGRGGLWLEPPRQKYDLASGDVLAFNGPFRGAIKPLNGDRLGFHHFVARFEHLICLFAASESSLLQALIETFSVGRHYPASNTHFSLYQTRYQLDPESIYCNRRASMESRTRRRRVP